MVLSTAPALHVSVDAQAARITITSTATGWTLSGPTPGPVHDLHLGANRVTFECDQPTPVTCTVEWGGDFVRFRTHYRQAVSGHGVLFPNFDQLPADLHGFSYQDRTFAPPSFKLNDTSTPWLLFDAKGKSLILSPASQFMVAKMVGDGKTQLAEGLNVRLKAVPSGTDQDALLTFAPTIHEAWQQWGTSLRGIYGRPTADRSGDPMLTNYGYWTDNGADYYYNYDRSLGYAGTLLKLAKRYADEKIPLHYLQLDSWWYFKSTTGPDGRPGGKFKNPALPEGEWNRYGGLMEYRAHPALFPNGLAAFDRELGLPLAVHNRWVDPASPYHAKYKINGLGAVDPAWWSDIAQYLKASGVKTYEQDWLVDIYGHSPDMSSEIGPADAFTDNMAALCAKNGMYVQYCMGTPRFFLQGVKYPNLTTIRTSDDRFLPARWHDFLYTSQLATAVGALPWCDVFKSHERENLILDVLSDGPVGTGDAIGKEDLTNLRMAMLPDGSLVKPDRSLLPIDRTYLEEAEGTTSPFIAATATDANHTHAAYVVAFKRKDGSVQAAVTPAELGLTGGRYYFLDLGSHEGRFVGDETLSIPLSAAGFAEVMVAPVSTSGIAMLGDLTKIVPTSSRRIASITETLTSLTAVVRLSPSETDVTLTFAGTGPIAATVRGGKIIAQQWDSSSQRLSVTLTPAKPGRDVQLTVIKK